MCVIDTGAGTCIKAFQNIYVSRESIDKERNNARAPGGTQSVSQMIAARCQWRLHLVILLQTNVKCRQTKCGAPKVCSCHAFVDVLWSLLHPLMYGSLEKA